MQAVVVHDVVVLGIAVGEIEHECEVGMVIGHERRGRHGYIGLSGGGQGYFVHPQRFTREAGVGTDAREKRYVMAALHQSTRQMPHMGLQPTGKRLPNGVAIRRDQCDTARCCHARTS